MQIWPAIDIRDGNCVRLQQGDYDRETVFSDRPVEMARHWVEQGATCLHLVDLDGARDGVLTNGQVIEQIVQAVDVPCQLGGGIRDEPTIAELLRRGVQRLVVGTQALKEPDWFGTMLTKYPQRLVLGIDARDGQVATDGWLKTSQMSAIDLAQLFHQQPLVAIVYTDISRDGMLQGPNLKAMEEMKRAVDCPVIASGGVSTAADVGKLAEIGLDGCIVGRALYEKQLTLAEALRAARIEETKSP